MTVPGTVSDVLLVLAIAATAYQMLLVAVGLTTSHASRTSTRISLIAGWVAVVLWLTWIVTR